MTRYHAHRRDNRALAFDALRVLGEGAVFLFCLSAIVVALWLVAP